MPLIKATLAQQLEASLKRRPQSAAEAAADWATAYVSYASLALSSVSSLPVTASANQGILLGAFTGGLQAQSSASAGGLIATGVISFWSAMVWAGPSAAGSTASPGNASLSSALAAVFSDTSEKSEGDKARAIADAFDAGARMVMVNDILFATGSPVVGPIS